MTLKNNPAKSSLIFNLLSLIFKTLSSLILRSVLIFNLVSLIFVFSCSKDSTSPQTITISGTVTLQGQTDHSGVTVSLYRPVQLDTALVRINQQYPNIGLGRKPPSGKPPDLYPFAFMHKFIEQYF